MDKIIIDKDMVLSKLFLAQKQESEKDKLRHIKIINSQQKIISVSTKDVRDIAKFVSKNDYSNFLEQAKLKNKDDEFYEETLVQGLVIANSSDLNFMKNNFAWWILKIDNWATCDTVVSTIKNKIVSKETFDYFYDLCFSDKEFVARFGIVNMLAHFVSEEYIDKILEMCLLVKNESFYVQMALAWLLSVTFVKFKDKTYDLLKKRALPKFVQNKAISKCRDSFRVSKEDKDNLVKFRI